MSTVVLPISPVEDASESDSASDDWGSEFDDSYVDENEDDLYEVVGDISQRIAANVSQFYYFYYFYYFCSTTILCRNLRGLQ